MDEQTKDNAIAVPPPAFIGEERLSGDAKRADDWRVVLINSVNALLGRLIGKMPGGIGRRDPNPARAAFDVAEAEKARTPKLDKVREVLRVGRRIKLGATIDQARLSEPLLGALLTMPRPELGKLLVQDEIAVARWTAVQQGVASADPEKSYERVMRKPAPSQRLPREKGTGFDPEPEPVFEPAEFWSRVERPGYKPSLR